MHDHILTERTEQLTEKLATLVGAHEPQPVCSVAVVESLTGGLLASAISAADRAGKWFRGSIVAYHPEVKHELLSAPPGSVVTAETASAMATAAIELLGADFTVALTGVGGPGPDSGEPEGTVFIATAARGEDADARLHRFEGEPADVLRDSIHAALEALIERVASRVDR